MVTVLIISMKLSISRFALAQRIVLAWNSPRRKINSLLLFTGTPHRGKDFGFFGLMNLARPDLFDTEDDKIAQLASDREEADYRRSDAR